MKQQRENKTELFTVRAEVILKKGEGRMIKSGGPWIFDNEIASVRACGAADGAIGREDNDPATYSGSIVRVFDFDGYPMGYGFYNSASKIRVRMLCRYRKEPVDRAFLAQRVRDAWEYRRQCVDTSSCRLIFGEADWLPGLVIDKYEDLLVVQSLARGIDRLKRVILTELLAVLKEDGILIRGIYERSDAPVRRKEGMPLFRGWLMYEGQWADASKDGSKTFDCDPHVLITENGIRYRVDVAEGQKTGFFLDQKYNRLAMQRFSSGKKVLDCFTHMGTFALNAAYAGASSVLALDISEFALAQARENARLNHLEDRVAFRQADVLEELPKLIAAGESYDVVILDPPAFTKSRAATKAAVRGYRKINTDGMKLVRDGGILATCSCSRFFTEDLMKKTIAEAARSAHKRLRQIEMRTQSPDHPILWAADESYYLKFFIFQVCRER